MTRPALDLKDKKFGRLTVIAQLTRRAHNGEVRWACACECGKMKAVSSNSLTSGRTKSCGCLREEVSKQNLSRMSILRSDTARLQARDEHGKFIKEKPNEQ